MIGKYTEKFKETDHVFLNVVFSRDNKIMLFFQNIKLYLKMQHS